MLLCVVVVGVFWEGGVGNCLMYVTSWHKNITCKNIATICTIYMIMNSMVGFIESSLLCH